MATGPRTHTDYLVGWVCALPKEQTAAIAMLDEEHDDDLPKCRNDPNTYTLGSISKHNVVIACLPMGKIGVGSAATVASHMVETFPAIRFGLMVGIAGGIPPKVRLGDVVVSVPSDSYPGVVQWDMGKTEHGGKFRRTGALNNPPISILTALTKLESHHQLAGPKIPQYLKELGEKFPRLKTEYLGSDVLEDVLFSADYAHVSSDTYDEADNRAKKRIKLSAEEDACHLCDRTQTVEREPRKMHVHYGLIASGNQVIKDAACRDQLSTDLGGNVLAVEMEAAGLMDTFPCVVIRGICDYADSHKNKAWQKHAAAIAAAFAKELLTYIKPDEVDKENTAQAEIANRLNNIQMDLAHTNALIDDKKVSEVLDWLTPNSYGAKQSDTLKRWHRETGAWFTMSEKFQEWMRMKKSTLFCPGLPGAGKTIIVSAVIHHLSNHYPKSNSVGIAYIYCTFDNQSEQTIEHFLASLLRQLVQGQDSLFKTIEDLYGFHRHKGTKPTRSQLSAALQSVVSKFERVFLVIDALDEWATRYEGRKKALDEIFELQARSDLNILVTSRIQEDSKERFDGNGAVQMQILAQDQDLAIYLRDRMKGQDSELFSVALRDAVVTEITSAAEGMFLLAELHLNALIDLPTRGHIKEALSHLTRGRSNLDYVYQLAMKRIESQGPTCNTIARDIISWIVYAQRPLSTNELQHALAIRPGADKINTDFIPTQKTIRSICAGLVTIDEESEIVRLIHYTTQEYFARTADQWFPGAQRRITEACATYLSFQDFANGHCSTDGEFEDRLLTHPLYHYAAQNWGLHYREIQDSETLFPFLRNKAQVQASCQALLAKKIHSGDNNYSQRIPGWVTGLQLAAFFGLKGLLQAQLDEAHLKIVDNHGRTPLSWAAANGHEAVVRLLLATGQVKVDLRDNWGRTPLLWAAEMGNEAVVRLLLATGQVEVDLRAYWGRTPLSMAAEKGHEAVVRLLLATGQVNVNLRDNNGCIPLSWAAEMGHEAVVRLLLATSQVEVDSRAHLGYTPLSIAAERGHEAVVRLLLATGQVEVDLRDNWGRTPLSIAAEMGHEAVVRLLLATGQVEVDLRDNWCYTPLLWAAEMGHEAVVRLLLATGQVKVDFEDYHNYVPLSFIAKKGYKAIIQLLLTTS